MQSHQSPLPYPWIESCLDSVRQWCMLSEYEYRFIGDELFDSLTGVLSEIALSQRVVASDLARLLILQKALDEGFETVIWLDADFLIFNPSEFDIPEQPYAVGREVWVQNDKHGRLKAFKKVHNAFLMFRRRNSFLSFYIETAERLLLLNQGAISPQFIGPKLLTAIHNVAILPVMETAAMFSPMVINGFLQGQGMALDLFKKNSIESPAGANLCISSCDRNEVSESEMQQLINLLLSGKIH